MSASQDRGRFAEIALKAAAGLGAVYFGLQLLVPPLYYLFNQGMVWSKGSPMLGVTWLLESLYVGPTGYGIISPLLIVTFAALAVGLIGLSRDQQWQKLSSYKLMVSVALVSTVFLLITSVVFSLFVLPNLALTSTIPIPEALYLPLIILFTATAIVSVVFFTAFVLSLIRQRQLAWWAGLLLVLGLLAINLNWFAAFHFPHAFLANRIPLSGALLPLLGVGWSIAIWHIGNRVGDDQPVAQNWPTLLRWRALVTGVVVVVGLWGLLLVGVYVWDSRHANASCRGSQSVKELDASHTDVTQHSAGYQFTYTISPDMPWQGSRWNSENGSDDCTLSTWRAPDWVFNRALSLPPMNMLQYRLYKAYAPKQPDVVAYFSVARSDQRFTTLDELQADMEHAMKIQQDGGVVDVPQTDFADGELAGQASLVVRSELNRSQLHLISERTILLRDGKEFSVGWRVSATSSGRLSEFIKAHRSEMETMVQSFRFE